MKRTTNGRRGRHAAATGTLLLLLLLVGGGEALAKRKPKPPPPPPPPPPPVESPYYTIVSLPAWGHGVEFNALNEAGQVAGRAATGNGEAHAVAWFPEDTDADGKPDRWYRDDDSDGVNDLLIDIGVLGGTTVREAYMRGINDSGMVVGASTHDNHPVGHEYQSRAFLWQDVDGDRVADASEFHMLGALEPGKASNGYGINNLGQVVGISAAHGYLITPEDVDGDGDLDWFDGTDPETGKNDLMVDLGDYNHFIPMGISDDGRIFGQSFATWDYALLTPADMDADGELEWWWDADADGHNDLLEPVPGLQAGDTGKVLDLAQTGEMAGWSFDNRGDKRAVLWTAGLLPIDLGLLPGESEATAEGLNEVGQVVGSAETWTYKRNKPPTFLSATGFLHENGTMKDLLALALNPTGILRLWPYDINDDGVIGGHLRYASGPPTTCFVAWPSGQ